MLILTRNLGQSIIINGDTTVTVMQVNGRQVRLGIAAPRNVTVDREEIHLAKQKDGTVPASKSKFQKVKEIVLS